MPDRSLQSISATEILAAWNAVTKVIHPSRFAIGAEKGCWPWLGALNCDGYGHLWHAGKMWQAARLSYSLANDGIPDGLVPDHLCRVRACIFPFHLEAVTNRTNLLRGQGFVARFAAQTHCHRGHAFTVENTYLTKRNIRDCKACRRFRQKGYADARRA